MPKRAVLQVKRSRPFFINSNYKYSTKKWVKTKKAWGAGSDMH